MSSSRILVFSGSIRTGAFSGKLAAVAAKELSLIDADVTKISLADYALPLFDGDLATNKDVPENAKKLAHQIAAHQGVFIATPEHNNSVPALLKNTIDWISRISTSEIPYRHRVYGLGSTAPGPVGGARALVDLRNIVMSGLGGIVIPEKVEVGNAIDAFDESGNLIAEQSVHLLRTLCTHLVEFSGRSVEERLS